MTSTISDAPSFRTIPAMIYNGLPADLQGAIGGPIGDQANDVPIASDGRAVLLTLGGTPRAGAGDSQSFTVSFDQVIPKPLCADGPYDWVHVSGPVRIERHSAVDAAGRYRYAATASGRLTVTPVDVTTTPPSPTGTSYEATIAEDQQGFTDGRSDGVFARSKRIAPQNGGAEVLMRDLKVASGGAKTLRMTEQCLQPAP
jgi:hypothetical protein